LAIPIYPPIKVINIKLSDELEHIECLELFDYQYYNFEFLLDNLGLNITSTDISVYVYKNEEYKVLLEEIQIIPKSDKQSKLNYNYLHKKLYKKIEFKIFYKYQSSTTEEEGNTNNSEINIETKSNQSNKDKETEEENQFNLKPFVIIQKDIKVNNI